MSYLFIYLSDLVALLLQDKSTVVAQLEVNHRQLSLNFLKGKDFQGRMQQKGYDFSEEMHALIYEVINKKEYDSKRHQDTS